MENHQTTMAKLTSAQAQADRRAAALERRDPAIKGDLERIKAIYNW